MKAKDLIQELKKLHPETEVFSTQWIKRNSETMPFMSYLLNVKGLKSSIDQDTNTRIFYLETDIKEFPLWQTEVDQSK